MKRIRNILIGWGKATGLLQTTPAEAKLSELRQQICSSCPLGKYSSFIDIVNGAVTEAEQLVCTRCHCPVLQKTLVIEENCPEEKW